MASNTKKAKAVRKWKAKPNKANLKTCMKREKKTLETLKGLASEDKS